MMRLVWRGISAALVAAGCIALAFHLFPYAFPLVNLTISMNRTQALHKANELAKQYSIGPDTFFQAANFKTDTQTKTFIELEAGGVEHLITTMKNHWFEPYTWQVRHAYEFNAHEALFIFTPDGVAYGFIETLSEDTPGTNLDAAQARAVGEEHAQDVWNINLDEYTLIQESFKTMPSERVDHTFTYEKEATDLGEGKYQLSITVSGDKCTGINQYIKIPDDFNRRYQEIRSANNFIAWLATFFMLIVYLLLCVGYGLFLCSKKDASPWKMSVLWGFGIAALQALVFANQLPLFWIGYPTTVSRSSFLLQLLFGWLIAFVIEALKCTAIIAAAQELTKRAWGNHVQLWNNWHARVATAWPFITQTLGSYWVVCIDLLFVVSFYGITTRVFGWWIPADALADPNILATYAPWLSAIAISIKAGFIEECLFRAVPLSCAALLGRRYNKATLFVSIAFVIQVLVFGAAHANYPGLPAYSRLIELIVPSCIFGGIYLRYGLFPAALTHIVYDIFWFSLPIFISSATRISQASIILISLIPVWVIIVRRWQTGRFFNRIPDDAYNHAFIPTTAPQADVSAKKEINTQPQKSISSAYATALLLGGIFAAGIASWYTPKNHMAEAITLDRKQALLKARTYLQEQDISLSNEWTELVSFYDSYATNYDQKLTNKFVWETKNQELYTTMLNERYITPPHWYVRFARFSGTSVERAEEYGVYLDGDGAVFRFVHTIAQSAQLPSISQEEAREKAYQELYDRFGIQRSDLQELSAESFKEPARTDWLFIFNNTKMTPLLPDGQARTLVIISGDTITDSRKFIHIPQEWARAQQGKLAIEQTTWLALVFALMLIMLTLWIKGCTKALFFKINTRPALILIGVFVVLQILNIIDALPALYAHFNTSEPWTNQLVSMVGSMTLSSTLRMALFVSLLIGASNPFAITVFTGIDFPMGLMIGYTMATVTTVLSAWIPSAYPLWPTFTGLDFTSPLYVLIYSTVRTYITCLMMLYILMFLLAVYARESKLKTVLLCTSFFVFMMCGAHFFINSPIELVPLLAKGIALGIMGAYLYWWYIRYQPSLLITAPVGYFIMGLSQESLLHATPHNYYFYAMSVLVVCAAFISSQLQKTKAQKQL